MTDVCLQTPAPRSAADPASCRNHVLIVAWSRSCFDYARIKYTRYRSSVVPLVLMASAISDMNALRAKLKEAFDMFDKDGKGTVIDEYVHS